MRRLSSVRQKLAGVAVVPLLKRLLKPLALRALDWCRDEVQENWRQGHTPTWGDGPREP